MLSSKIVSVLRVSTRENHTQFSGTYPSSPNEGVPPSPRVDMDQRNAAVESDVWQTQTADIVVNTPTDSLSLNFVF